MLLKVILLRLFAARSFAGALALLATFALPVAAILKVVGLPLLIVLGIVAIPLACCGMYGGFLLPIAAIVCGVLGMKKADQGLASNKGLALSGLICGIVAVVLALIIIVLQIAGVMTSNYSSYY